MFLQECDVKLMPGNLYFMQGPNLYCQSHYHGDGGNLALTDPSQPNLNEGDFFCTETLFLLLWFPPTD